MTEPTKPELNCSVCGNPQGSQHITDHGHMFYVHPTDSVQKPEPSEGARRAAEKIDRNLTFAEFQAINKHRCETKFHQCSEWLPMGWPLAIAGEAGELCNLIKKIVRGDFTLAEKRADVLRELADVITYSDLMITALGADTATVVAGKFDEVSQRVGYKQKIIDRETHSAEMRKALEALLACEQVDYHGSGTSDKVDDCEVCMAVDIARAALKGGAL